MRVAIPAFLANDVVRSGRAFRRLNARRASALRAAGGVLIGEGMKGAPSRLTVLIAAGDFEKAARKAWSVALEVNGWRE